MKATTALWLAGTLCVLCGGCRKDSSTGEGAAASASAAPGGEVPPAAFEPIGVPKCDRYFALARDCFAKKPELAASFANLLGGQHDAWKASAATPEGRETLEAVCASSLDDLEQKCK